MLFSLSANSPVRDAHRAANHSSLRRPSSRASAPIASSSSTLAHARYLLSLSPTPRNQPPRLNPSSPVGSWPTPSSETPSLMTIFPMSHLLSMVVSATHRNRRRESRNWAAAGRPVRASAGVYTVRQRQEQEGWREGGNSRPDVT